MTSPVKSDGLKVGVAEDVLVPLNCLLSGVAEIVIANGEIVAVCPLVKASW